MRATVLVSLASLSLQACVSEPLTRETHARIPSAEVSAPSRPLASPVVDASVVSRVQFAVRPLGSLPFDGQVLPISSPSGQRCAVQIADSPPDWQTLLAKPGASVPHTTVHIYDLTARPITPIDAAPIDTVLLLSLGADSSGVLVESPRPDGSRHLARLPWHGGDPQWLVTDQAVSTRAIDHFGSIVFVQRPIDAPADAPAWRLIVQDDAGNRKTWHAPAIEPLFPLPSPDPSLLCLIARTPNGLEAIAVRGGGQTIAPTPISRTTISRRSDEVTAYQAAITATAAWSPDDPEILLFHPISGRAAAWHIRTGTLVPLLEDSISAVPAEGGYLVATRTDLRFMPRLMRPNPSPPSARVLDMPAVARPTPSGDAPFLVLGPSPTADRELQAWSLQFEIPSS